MKLEKLYPKKRVVITGAGSGLGKALAAQFASRKWNVAIADIQEQRAHDTACLAEKLGGKGIAITCDVTKESDCVSLFQTVRDHFEGCDILINNAGVAAAGFFEKIPP